MWIILLSKLNNSVGRSIIVNLFNQRLFRFDLFFLEGSSGSSLPRLGNGGNWWLGGLGNDDVAQCGSSSHNLNAFEAHPAFSSTSSPSIRVDSHLIPSAILPKVRTLFFNSLELLVFPVLAHKLVLTRLPVAHVTGLVRSHEFYSSAFLTPLRAQT